LQSGTEKDRAVLVPVVRDVVVFVFYLNNLQESNIPAALKWTKVGTRTRRWKLGDGVGVWGQTETETMAKCWRDSNIFLGTNTDNVHKGDGQQVEKGEGQCVLSG